MATDRTMNPLEQLSLEQLRQRTSIKWRAYPPDVLPLWVAEMDVVLAAPIARALHEAIDRGDTGYPAGDGLARALAGFAARRWGWLDFPVDRTSVVPDVMMGIVELIRVLTGPGDPVIVTTPVYPPFFAFVTHADRRIVTVPLGGDGRLDINSLETAFASAAASSARPVFLLCSPHNPTGVLHTPTELAAVAKAAARHGVRVIVDEIHAPLALPGACFTPYLTVPGSEDAFSVMSASKAWNLAGLKTAIVIAGPAARDDLERIPEEVGHGPSHLGVIAHTAAYRDGEPWLDDLLTALAENRTLVADLVASHLPQVDFLPPEATFLAWLDCRSLGLDTAPPIDGPGLVTDLSGTARFFIDHAKVALNSGHVFGPGGDGHVRLNFATSREILTSAIHRLAEAVDTRFPDRRSAT